MLGGFQGMQLAVAMTRIRSGLKGEARILCHAGDEEMPLCVCLSLSPWLSVYLRYSRSRNGELSIAWILAGEGGLATLQQQQQGDDSSGRPNKKAGKNGRSARLAFRRQ